jgi:AcrR family transcriptional regulator
MAVREQVRIGGRSARIQAAVHAAVKELTAEADRGELTVPVIAARAGVTPSTIYRRWGDLPELLADVAVERLRPVADPADTGATETDLQVWVEQYTEEMSSEIGRALLRDIFAQTSEATHPGACCGFTYDQLGLIAARAAARGEAAFDVEEAVDHVIAPIAYHILFGRRDPTLAYANALLDRFWRCREDALT